MKSHGTQRGMVCGLCAVTLVLLCEPSRSYAEAIGGPAKVEKGQWVLGLGGGGLRKRQMKGGADASLYEGAHFRGYGLTERLTLYGDIGAAYITVNDSAVPSTVGRGFGTNLFATGQLKLKLWENIRHGLEWDGSAQYLYAGVPHKRNNNQASWHEERLATTLAKSLGDFTPYLGVELSAVQFDYKFRSDKFTLDGTYKPKSVVGPVVGMSWCFGEHKDTVLNIEATYVNGAEVTVGLSKRY